MAYLGGRHCGHVVLLGVASANASWVQTYTNSSSLQAPAACGDTPRHHMAVRATFDGSAAAANASAWDPTAAASTPLPPSGAQIDGNAGASGFTVYGFAVSRGGSVEGAIDALALNVSGPGSSRVDICPPDGNGSALLLGPPAVLISVPPPTAAAASVALIAGAAVGALLLIALLALCLAFAGAARRRKAAVGNFSAMVTNPLFPPKPAHALVRGLSLPRPELVLPTEPAGGDMASAAPGSSSGGATVPPSEQPAAPAIVASGARRRAALPMKMRTNPMASAAVAAAAAATASAASSLQAGGADNGDSATTTPSNSSASIAAGTGHALGPDLSPATCVESGTSGAEEARQAAALRASQRRSTSSTSYMSRWSMDSKRRPASIKVDDDKVHLDHEYRYVGGHRIVNRRPDGGFAPGGAFDMSFKGIPPPSSVSSTPTRQLSSRVPEEIARSPASSIGRSVSSGGALVSATGSVTALRMGLEASIATGDGDVMLVNPMLGAQQIRRPASMRR